MINELEILRNRLAREKKARIEAEKILEDKSRELYENNLKLNELNNNLKSEIEKRTSEIVDKEKKYREFIESSSDIIYTTDENGNFTFINETAVKVTGYEKNELIGQHYLILIPQDFHAKIEDYYANQLLENKRTSYFEFPIFTKDSKVIWIGQTVDLVTLSNDTFEVRASGRDITEKKQLEEFVNKSEEKYRNIIENLELGLLEVNTKDEIVNVYPKFTQLTGYSKDELIGKKAIETFLPDEFKEIMLANNSQRKKGLSSVYEVQIICKNKELKWVMISGAPYYDKSDEIIGTLGIHLDITDRKIMETELLQAKDQAEKSIQTQELFMANMSHEIRTPMNAIIGMNDLLLNSELSKRQRDYAKTVKTSAESLLVIINDVLDFSKIEAGKLELDPIDTPIREVLENCVKVVSFKAEEKGLQLSIDIDKTISQFHIFDGIRLNQVIINLLGNAIKFTEKGFIKILCENISTEGNFQHIKFSVIDSGIGLSKDSISKVFDSFIQAEQATSRKYGGTGLGLSISKSLILQMGSNLLVDSEEGVGSNFHFTLKLKKSELQTQINKNEQYENIDLEGLKVLLVDDNKINRFIALTFLEQKGCFITEAENGQKAIELIKSQEFDIILLDIRMPVLDGFQTTKIIRDELNLLIPIIALTANAIKGDSDRCLAAGMNDYLSKPFTKEELFGKINYIVKNNFIKRVSKKSKSFLDLKLLQETTFGNKEFQTKMINLLLTELPKDIEKMQTEGMNQSNLDIVNKTAHKIKPSIDYIGISSLRNDVRTVEALDNWNDDSKTKCVQLISNLKTLLKELNKVK